MEDQEKTAPNVQIVHQGQGYSVGAIVPKESISHLDRKLELGAVIETHLPVNTETIITPTPNFLGKEELVSENARLSDLLKEYPGKVKTLQEKHAEEKAKSDALKNELEATKKKLGETLSALKDKEAELEKALIERPAVVVPNNGNIPPR